MKKALLICAVLSTMLMASSSAFAGWNLWSVGGSATISGNTVTLTGGNSATPCWTKNTENNATQYSFAKSFLSTSDYNGDRAYSVLGESALSLSNITNPGKVTPTNFPYVNLFVSKTIGTTSYFFILGSMYFTGTNLSTASWKAYETYRKDGDSLTAVNASDLQLTMNSGYVLLDSTHNNDLILDSAGWLNWNPIDPTFHDSDAVRIVYGDSKVADNYPGSASFDFTGNVVPEPSSILALLGGLGSLVAIRRRRA